jgi:Spy/CpxP family protein refolding chaperone
MEKTKIIMKKSMIFFGLMIASTVMFAQRKVDPMERAAKQAEHMKKELGLDEVQYKAVKAINEEHAGKVMKLFGDSTISQEAKHQQMKTLRNEKETALRKVLTEEQHKKRLANQSDHHRKHGAKMAKHRGNYAGRMQKELSLTDEQNAKMKAINREFGQKFRALRNDSTLSKEDNQTKMKQLKVEYQEKMKSVLTEEQFEKWEQLKSEHRRRRT